MPRYFFNIYENGKLEADTAGTMFADISDVRLEAMKLLPAVAKDEVAHDGDRQAFTVIVENEDGRAVYTASLTYAGLWLQQAEA